MSDFEGMRWFKCDLQMQTPADAANWRGVAMEGGEEGARTAAETFVRTCYFQALEVVAITDHNFLSKDFIPALQAAIQKLGKEFGYELVLFPGFEFEADVGKGVHVIALFEPTAQLPMLDHILTECGVTVPRLKDGVLTKSTQRLPEILDRIQTLVDGRQRGLVIMPHLMSNDGLFDNDKVSDWLQQAEFVNPALLAVEVPKPVSTMSPGFQRLFRAGEDCEPAWRRARPMACLMSSDNKAYTEEEDEANFIGKRFSWIKMSEPSIESLRQACLDHESRIRLQLPRPSDDERHPRIVSIAIRKASFLEDQTIAFSPNLNCVIGGRGSGKSSLLEYLRFCIDTDYHTRMDRDLQLKLDGIRGTVGGPDAELHIVFETAPGVTDTVVLKPAVNDHRIVGREVSDLPTVLRQLRVQFFSQGELTRLSKPGGSNQVLRLIDAACGDRLTELQRKETALRAEVEAMLAAVRQAEVVAAELQRTKQERDELTRQWQARKDVQVEAEVHLKAETAKRFLAKVESSSKEDAEAVRASLQTLEQPLDLPDEMDAWPKTGWFAALSEKVNAANATLRADLEAAVVRYEQAIAASTNVDPSWAEVNLELAAAEDAFVKACVAKGLARSDVEQIQELDRQRSSKNASIESFERRLATLEGEVAEFGAKLAQLHDVWRLQFDERHTACEGMRNATTVVTPGYMLDHQSFDAVWQRIAPRDNRTRLGKAWEDIGKALFAEFAKETGSPSPWEIFDQWLGAPAALAFDHPAKQLFDDLIRHVTVAEVRAVWEQVRLTRVDDVVEVELRRPDGSSAGRMSGAGGTGLSEGQRNTALLSLILSQGTGPIVIDQPEDELDSNYIFTDLVPMLRKAKNGRQLIIATHNANLPVNADAELIYAFDAKAGRGRLRSQGGLDRPGVTEAVLDIMEGSEEAIRRRIDKYHF